MSTYDDVVAEVAKDLELNEEFLRRTFSAYLEIPAWTSGNKTRFIARHSAAMFYACYAVYRLTKAHDSFKMTSASRERWRDRAMSLGSPGHLVEPRA